MGVGSRGGAEAIVHTVREWFQKSRGDTKRIIAQIDLANAFNTLDQHGLLEASRVYAPCLTLWFDWCYGHDSWLWVGGARIRSRTGVQHAISKVRHRVVECPGTNDFVVFSGVIAGTDDAVKWYLEALDVEFKPLGSSSIQTRRS